VSVCVGCRLLGVGRCCRWIGRGRGWRGDERKDEERRGQSRERTRRGAVSEKAGKRESVKACGKRKRVNRGWDLLVYWLPGCRATRAVWGPWAPRSGCPGRDQRRGRTGEGAGQEKTRRGEQNGIDGEHTAFIALRLGPSLCQAQEIFWERWAAGPTAPRPHGSNRPVPTAPRSIEPTCSYHSPFLPFLPFLPVLSNRQPASRPGAQRTTNNEQRTTTANSQHRTHPPTNEPTKQLAIALALALSLSLAPSPPRIPLLAYPTQPPRYGQKKDRYPAPHRESALEQARAALVLISFASRTSGIGW
jgi:hypothetical protein